MRKIFSSTKVPCITDGISQIKALEVLSTFYQEGGEQLCEELEAEAWETTEYLEGFQFQQEDKVFGEDGELKGVRVIEGYDREQERDVRELIGFVPYEVDTPIGPVQKWQPIFDVWQDDGSTIDAHFTITGEMPVIWSEAAQADMKYPSHLMALVPDTSSFDKEECCVGQPFDYGHMLDWSEYRTYCFRTNGSGRNLIEKARIRRLEALKYVRWIIRTNDKRLLQKARQRFWLRLIQSRKVCSETKDWSTVWLTKPQADYIRDLLNLKINLK